MKLDYSADVLALYNRFHGRATLLNERHMLEAGTLVERLFPPADAHATLCILAALNLLNAGVKKPWGRRLVTYNYIKGMAACLYIRLLTFPVEHVEVYMDRQRQITYFRALGVQVSFHYLPLYRELLQRLPEVIRQEQQWVGLRLQEIAVELLRMACPLQLSIDEQVRQHVQQCMLNYRRPRPSRIFSRPHPWPSVEPLDDDASAPAYAEGHMLIDHLPKTRQGTIKALPYSENKIASLYSALDFNTWQGNVFLLWRRSNHHTLPVVRYDGTNYELLTSYLLSTYKRVCPRPENTLERGKFYTISPQKRIRCISPSRYLLNLTRNSYLRTSDSYRNLCITYGIARYLSVLFPRMRFVCTLNYNHVRTRRRYYDHASLYDVPLDSPARRLKVWMVVDRCHDLRRFDPGTLPQSLVDEYMGAEDFYNEFEITTGPQGLKGICAYREYQLLPNIYVDIQLRNYHAHVLGEEGRWAIYALCEECFKTDFIYDRIWYDPGQGAVKGEVMGEEYIIYQFRLADPEDKG